MTGPATTIELKGIASLLGDSRLQVPTHQRPFEWEREQIDELLGDIQSAYESRTAEYFLGSIVVISSGAPKWKNVLDGQQRLATISLLLAGIADEFTDRDDHRRAGAVRRTLSSLDITSGVEQPHLKLSAQDDMYFQSLLSQAYPKPAAGAPESHKRLYQARVTTRRWVQSTAATAKDPIDWLSRLSEYLRESVQVIHFAVPDDSNAFAIFETLNDRGLDLSIADLLKNYLLGRARPTDANAILSLWTKVFTTLNANRYGKNFTDFLRHYWSSAYEVAREKDVYRKVKSTIKTPTDVTSFASTLDEESYYYAALLSPEHELWPASASDTLRTLMTLGLEQHRPFLLAAVQRFASKPSQLEELLKLLVSWNVRLLIVGGGGGGVMEAHYASLGREVRTGNLKTAKEIAKKAADFVPKDKVFVEAFTVARVSNAALARYYLRRLEEVASGKDPELVPAAQLTLEHVLPERPGDNWPEFDDDQKQAYTKRLGNMILLTQKMNNKLKSEPFSVKQAEYKKSKLTLTQEIAKRQNWRVEEIEAHQKRQAELVVQAWPL